MKANGQKQRCLAVRYDHGFVPPPLIALFDHPDILVKPFTKLFTYVSQVVSKEIQVRMQKMQL